LLASPEVDAEACTSRPWLLLPPLLVSPGQSSTGVARLRTLRSRRAETTTSATCDHDCRAAHRAQRRATREAQDLKRCREFLSRVALTYRITAVPQAAGQAIGLHMTLENRSKARLAGSTGGVLRVSPRPTVNQISWGGSSADELYQKPGTTSQREIWHDRRPPGWHPVGTQVTSFDFNTYVYGPGDFSCFIPATVLAPRGLVDGHSSGRWTQESNPHY
jgi:hypothetical protein